LPVRAEATPRMDEMFATLADRERRRVLLALLEHNPQPEVIGVGSDDFGDDRRLLQLTHAHLPKLEAAGYIEWDRDAHEVVKGPSFDEIRPLLELLDASEADLPDDLR